jgi:hypothetical protein
MSSDYVVGASSDDSSLLEEFRMGASPDENDLVAVEPIDQQEITSYVAFTVAGPVAGKLVISPFRGQWSGVGDQQQHHLFQVFMLYRPERVSRCQSFVKPFS